jgi:hypothetical protein
MDPSYFLTKEEFLVHRSGLGFTAFALYPGQIAALLRKLDATSEKSIAGGAANSAVRARAGSSELGINEIFRRKSQINTVPRKSGRLDVTV